MDPELINFSGGSGLRFRMATNDRVKNDATGEWEDKNTSWWTIKAWKKLAEQGKDNLKKGQEVTVVGTIKEETWVDKSGASRSSYVINADTISVSVKTLQKNLVSTPTNPSTVWDSVEEPAF
jgi:single-strand DNA-binding protein